MRFYFLKRKQIKDCNSRPKNTPAKNPNLLRIFVHFDAKPPGK